uniref:Uncharacterized protein n=1 Tax=Arundo donax TaxID=35708 RepID=A0A0A9D3C3_ARUDO
MVMALSTFLCPNSSTYPSPKYFFPLIESSTVDEWDWSTFVYDKLFDSIKKYKEKKWKTLGGCIYLFAISVEIIYYKCYDFLICHIITEIIFLFNFISGLLS